MWTNLEENYRISIDSINSARGHRRAAIPVLIVQNGEFGAPTQQVEQEAIACSGLMVAMVHKTEMWTIVRGGFTHGGEPNGDVAFWRA